MAKKPHVMQKYTPRIKLEKPVKMKDVAEYIAARASLNKGTIQNVIAELAATIVHFSRIRQPVKLEGLGTFRPVMTKDGSVKINFLADRELVSRVNEVGIYGTIKNKDLIGATEEELIAKWNEENPDDPVE